MKSRFEKGEDIHVITFREGDPKGIAARKCYASCGFTEGEELVVLIIPAKSFCAGYRDTKEGGGEDEAQLYIRFPVLEGRGNLL